MPFLPPGERFRVSLFTPNVLRKGQAKKQAIDYGGKIRAFLPTAKPYPR